MGIIIYSIIYSFLTIEKYLAFNATAADLGINAALLYGVFHGSISLEPGNQYFINTGKMIYLLLSPFYNVYPNEELLLVFQSFWIAFASFPIYLISRSRLKDEYLSVAFSLAWLLYFPMSGVNWFDFHFMALFPTFFLLGIALMEYGRKKAGLAFLILATITDFLIPMVMIIYGLELLYRDFREGRELRNNYVAPVLIILSLSIIFVTNLFFGVSYTLNYLINSATNIAAFKAGYGHITVYFILIFLPLLFFSILAPDILVMLLPFFFLVSFSDFSLYVRTFYIQYPALTAPIVFLAAIHGFRRFRDFTFKGKKITDRRKIKAVGTGIVLLNLVLAILFTPAGNAIAQPINGTQIDNFFTTGGQSYHTGSAISITSADANLSAIMSLIPKGSSVTGQNNMPQLLQGYSFFWPKQILSNHSDPVYPMYAIADQNNAFFNQPIFPGEAQDITAMNAFNYLYGTGQYGIYAEGGGIALIKRNYTGPPVYFQPIPNVIYLKYISVSAGLNSTVTNGEYSISNISTSNVLSEGYFSLPPGKFQLSLGLTSNEFWPANALKMGVFAGPDTLHDSLLAEITVNSTSLVPGEFNNLSADFQLPGYYPTVYFSIFDSTWNGTLLLQNLSLKQVN